MLIAVASQNFRTVTGHAGKARRFMVFEAETGQTPREVSRLDLPREQSMHEFTGGAHPLDDVKVLIAGSAGAGFISRMAQRGVLAVVTSETDPITAVANYFGGTLAALMPYDHDHEHEHDHGQDHDAGSEDCGCGCAS